MGTPATPKSNRQRIPATQRRHALVSAAVHEFAHGGLHGTPVERIAHRVGVAQPYVFSLFRNKRELFLAAVERCFDQTGEAFDRAAAEFRAGGAAAKCENVLEAMGHAYVELLESDRDALLLQHQAYAACDDDIVRKHVRSRYARLVAQVQELSGAEPERIDDFVRHGMALNVAAAMGVEDLSVACEWLQGAVGKASATASHVRD